MNRRLPLVAVLVAIAAVGVIAIACTSGVSSKSPVATGPSSSTTVSAGGFGIGAIKHLAGGTAVPTDVRTLKSAICTDGRLVVQTDRESVVGQMDCAQMPPSQILSGFLNKPVAISYNNQRLRIETANEGTLEFTVTSAAIGAGNVSP
jgi:hypothetical protein